MLNYVHVVIYASGIIAWVALAMVGISTFADRIIDGIIVAVWTKREFFAFVKDRLRRKHPLYPTE